MFLSIDHLAGVQFAIQIANAEMKAMRSHLVGKTPEEAMMLHSHSIKIESNQKFWNPNTNCPPTSRQTTANGVATSFLV
jgi:hypothetical protein